MRALPCLQLKTSLVELVPVTVDWLLSASGMNLTGHARLYCRQCRYNHIRLRTSCLAVAGLLDIFGSIAFWGSQSCFSVGSEALQCENCRRRCEL